VTYHRDAAARNGEWLPQFSSTLKASQEKQQRLEPVFRNPTISPLEVEYQGLLIRTHSPIAAVCRAKQQAANQVPAFAPHFPAT
jgi:hypothetical protein